MRPEDLTMDLKLDFFWKRALRLAREAEALGVVVTIERVPTVPFAMGKHEAAVTARPVLVRDPESAKVLTFGQLDEWLRHRPGICWRCSRLYAVCACNEAGGH